ncbi:MAG: diaminopimelate epimerase [Flammeovirgaceae bacterium]|nr:diaminopimelate epimerase [Flammeovirgaceae bacterium]
MKLHFTKYQATANDFVLVDNRKGEYQFTPDQIRKICDRRLGVGSDGLILLESDPSEEFKLIYYNPDGTQSLCGNGCRSAVDFAARLGIISSQCSFSAFDGTHQASILPDGQIRLQMNDVKSIESVNGDFFLNTGSPHYCKFVTNVNEYPVFVEGRKIRYDDQFPEGTNVNFIEKNDDHSLMVRTYERGVEEETYSCGTGVTAAALAASQQGLSSPVRIHAKGGSLTIDFKKTSSGSYTDIFLTGPAKMVFEGSLEL